MGNRWQYRGFLAGLVCFVVWSTVRAEHLPQLAWMASYTSASGTNCCSERDCVLAPVAVIQFGDKETTVLIHGTVVVLPAKSVHQSETMDSFWCHKDDAKSITTENTRCTFYVSGG